MEEEGLRNAYRVAGDGPGFTQPARVSVQAWNGLPFGDLLVRPVLRIDYVWVLARWRVGAAWIGEDAGSDHVPVVARIALAPRGGEAALA